MDMVEVHRTLLRCLESLPIVDSIVLSPTTICNDLITATVVLSDNDTTQTVTGHYAWHVIDATTRTDTVVLARVIQFSMQYSFDKGDEVYVIVTPNDGVDDGAQCSNSIIISNATHISEYQRYSRSSSSRR